MLRTTLLASGLVLALSMPAMADQCSDGMANLSKALKTAKVSDAARDQVNDLVGRAKQQQAEGKTKECVATLAEIKALIGMK